MNFEIKAKKALDLEKGQGFIIVHGFKGGYNETLQIPVFFGLALSFEPNIPNNQVTWQDPVTDEQYK